MADPVAHYKKLSKYYYRRHNKYCEHVYSSLLVRYYAGKRDVLELGCGAGRMARYVSGRYSGVDISPEMLGLNTYLKEGDKLFFGDAGRLEFEADSFDLVFSINLLEHVKDPSRVFRETRRMLKSGGKAFMITPNGDVALLLDILEKLRLKIPEGDHRFLKTRELIDLVAGSGLKPELQKKILPFPVRFVGKMVDGIVGALPVNIGLFHLVVCKK